MNNPHNNRSASPLHPTATSTRCRVCSGRGYIWDDHDDCHACSGRGFLEEKDLPSCSS